MSLTQLQAALTDRGLSAAEARLVVETGLSEGRIYVLHCQGVQADVYAVAGEACSRNETQRPSRKSPHCAISENLYSSW